MIPTHYTTEQKLRKAWVLKYQTIQGYHQATQEKKERVLNETNNH
jgi:hypothetical protein